MKTPKYARDTWGGIKKKLAAFAADAEKPAAGDGAGDDHETQPSAKKAKKAATPRKRKKDGKSSLTRMLIVVSMLT